MQKKYIIAVFIIAILLGSMIILGFYGGSFSNNAPAGSVVVDSYQESTTSTPSLSPTPTPQVSIPEVTEASNENTPEAPEIFAGNPSGEDIEDLLLLYDSNIINSFDESFCQIAAFYGLRCKQIDLQTTQLTDEVLRDTNGERFKLIGVSANTLFKTPRMLSFKELNLLNEALESGETVLYVGNLDSRLNLSLLEYLTDNAITADIYPEERAETWFFSDAAPEITAEFTGYEISALPTVFRADFPITINDTETTSVLMSARTTSGNEYPIFVRWQKEDATIIFDSAGQHRYYSGENLMDIYGDGKYSSYILPIMMTIRSVMGDEAWHRNTDYANLTIDDPSLVEPYFNLSYIQLLKEMEAHNFHTTISLIPVNWESYDEDIVTLFRRHENRYSIAQHGNNSDGYEFYKYEVTAEELEEEPDLIARPLADQEADIVEGLLRLNEMETILKLHYDKVMIFPSGISPAETLKILKKYNYLGTINAQQAPLGEEIPDVWDYGMYPADLNYYDFPLITRQHPGTYQPFEMNIRPFLFDLFLDKPALFYSNAYDDELFAESITAFNQVADEMNNLHTNLEWDSLGNILRHLYLEKTNDDGSISIKMFTNHIILENPSETPIQYHIQKTESFEIKITSVTVNGEPFPHQSQIDSLHLDLIIPPETSIEIEIQYGQ